MFKSNRRGIAWILVSGALVLGASRAAEAYWKPAETGDGVAATGSLDQLSKEFREVAKLVEPCVVHIEIKATPQTTAFLQTPEGELQPGSPEEFFRRFFEAPFGGRVDRTPQRQKYQQYDAPRTVGAGSGWIYDTKGHVITNNHVVKDAEALTVKLYDGREFDAKVVATDPATDIAVLQIDANNLTPGVLSDQPLEQGDIVFAFGSPFEFQFSMSQGIVSGKGRHTGILGPSGYEDFIQTDAAINPGNSGGPLTNARAEIVGMNSSILTGSGFFGGIGFAIPAPMIRSVVQQLIENKSVSRGQLGVYIQDDPQVMKSFGYEGTGAIVSDVLPDGPAAKANVKPGDIIAKLDGHDVESADELRQTIASRRPGTTVHLTLYRNGKNVEVDVVLGELTSPAMEAGAEHGMGVPQPQRQNDMYEPLRKLGIENAATLSPDTAQRLGVTETSGVLVQSVRANSAAFVSGIQPGVVITHVMDTPVDSVDALAQALSKYDLTAGVRLTVRVEGRDHFVFVELPK